MSEILLCKFNRGGKCIHPSKVPLHDYLDSIGAVKNEDIAQLTSDQRKHINQLMQELPSGTDDSFNLATRRMYCVVGQGPIAAISLCEKSEES
jgi:hypothetical protein